jgi:hypothetical protein
MNKAKSFSECFKAKKVETFIEGLHQKHYFIKSLVEDIGNYFTIEDFFNLFGSHPSASNQFQFITQNSIKLPLDGFLANGPTQILNSHAALRHFYLDQGSIVLDGPDLLHPGLAKLVAEISNLFKAQVHLSAFLTPANSKTFNVHWDDLEVIMLQVHGTKRWHLANAIFPFPLLGQTPRNMGYDLKTFPLQEPKDFLMEAGDCIYLNRGVPHDGGTLDVPSLHLSFGLSRTTFEDKLSLSMQMMNEEMRENVEFRKYFKKEEYLSPGQEEDLLKLMTAKLSANKNSLLKEEPGIVIESGQLFKNYLKFLQSPGISLTTKLLKTVSSIDYEYRTDKRVLNLRNKQHLITLTNRAIPTLEFIRCKREFEFGELVKASGMPLEGAYQLVIKLMESDMLTIPEL